MFKKQANLSIHDGTKRWGFSTDLFWVGDVENSRLCETDMQARYDFFGASWIFQIYDFGGVNWTKWLLTWYLFWTISGYPRANFTPGTKALWPNGTDLMQTRARLNGHGGKYAKSGALNKRQKKSGNAVRPKRALLCLTLGNPIRSAAINLVEWKYPFK